MNNDDGNKLYPDKTVNGLETLHPAVLNILKSFCQF